MNTEIVKRVAASLRLPKSRIAAWLRAGSIEVHEIAGGWELRVLSAKVAGPVTEAHFASLPGRETC